MMSLKEAQLEKQKLSEDLKEKEQAVEETEKM